MFIALLKMSSGFIIGSVVGRYCAKNELSAILGITLTFVCVIAVCLLIDKGFTDVQQ
jgi:FtsH-binding integral membrane protein